MPKQILLNHKHIVIVRWKSLLRIDYLLTFEAG